MKDPVDMGSVRAFKRYQHLLENRGVKPKDHTKIDDGDPTSLEHLLWMCMHCIPQIRDDGHGFSTAKYSRWLGYVQGVLIAKGITTVENERDQTRQYWS